MYTVTCGDRTINNSGNQLSLYLSFYLSFCFSVHLSRLNGAVYRRFPLIWKIWVRSQVATDLSRKNKYDSSTANHFTTGVYITGAW